ncbi:hypothetical protein Nepgr_007838 [Nepenthes gracilis]|uniref:Uncharacterized protein n=1 Tax=Nepenthes gracilis TaxID=150966 RepID=A0AAD3XIN9_NEPGR|nr:hypothetical protein Nepgr_007838 [Nepenthes gracilis]
MGKRTQAMYNAAAVAVDGSGCFSADVGMFAGVWAEIGKLDPVLKPPILGYSTSMRPDPPIANAVLVSWRNSCMDFDQLLLMTGSWILLEHLLNELFEKLLWVLSALGFPVDADFLVTASSFDAAEAGRRGLILCSLLEPEYCCPRNGGLAA